MSSHYEECSQLTVDELKQCSKCGIAGANPGAKFCYECGSMLQEGEAPKQKELDSNASSECAKSDNGYQASAQSGALVSSKDVEDQSESPKISNEQPYRHESLDQSQELESDAEETSVNARTQSPQIADTSVTLEILAPTNFAVSEAAYSPSLSTFSTNTWEHPELDFGSMTTDDDNARLIDNMEDCIEAPESERDYLVSKNSKRSSKSRERSGSSSKRTMVCCGKCHSDSGEFRVLRCGHALCLECLKAIYAEHNTEIPCPYDDVKDPTEPEALPRLKQFYSILSQSSRGKSESKKRTKLCGICSNSDDCRVLACGHAVCLECLKKIYDENGGKIRCPSDNLLHFREPHALPKPEEFDGEIFCHILDKDFDVNKLINRMVKQRRTTIQHLRDMASSLDSKEMKFAISKITGSATGIVGSVLTIIGITLTFTGVGAVVGVPMAIAGASVGAVGGATTGISAVAETIVKRKGFKEALEDLDTDRIRAGQVQTLLEKASENPELTEAGEIDPALLANVGRALPAIAKVGVTSAAGAELGFGVLRSTVGASLHIAGLALATVLIPLDLTQLIISLRKIHKKTLSTTVTELYDAANRLEEALIIFLVREEYFREVSTKDSHWAYIIVNAEKKQEFEERIQKSCTFEELPKFATIVESGIGDDPPKEVSEKMCREWFSRALP